MVEDRQAIAEAMAKNDGRHFESMPDILKKAYLHNADEDIKCRTPQVIEVVQAKPLISADVLKQVQDLSKEPEDDGPTQVEDLPTPESDSYLASKTIDQLLQSTAEKARVVDPTVSEKASETPKAAKVAKPSVAAAGTYSCLKCGSPHVPTSKIGKSHLKHRDPAEG